MSAGQILMPLSP